MVGALCSLALLAGAPAQAKADSPAQVYRDPNTGLLVYVADLTGRQPGEVRIGFTGQIYWFFNPFSPLEPAFGCAFVTPSFPHLVFCQGPPNGLLVQLGPGRNDVRVLGGVPVLPGPNLIQGNKGKDKIQGGQSDEQIKAGKGKDNVNPGPGRDNVDLGPGRDTINSRDGDRDVVNGGKGKDVATVDRKDKVKNVEKVKPK